MSINIQKIFETKIYKKFHQFIRFGIVGGTNFLIALIVYNLVLWIFRVVPDGSHSANQAVALMFRFDYQIANVFSFVISVLNAYILNRLWVFRIEAKKASQGAVVRFFASYGMTFALSIFLAWFWVEIVNIPKAVVPFLNVLITTPLNFLLSKYFAFRERKIHSEGVEILPYEEEKQEEVTQ